jgi:hypothetical protein
MEQPFRLSFSNGLTASVVQVHSSEDLSVALNELGLHSHRPIIVVVGGASKLSDEDLNRLRLLFVEVLAPLAEALGASVVDGGTDAGVMHLIGQARAERGAKFSLIGVAPVGKVALSESPLSDQETALEPHHTHFVLIPGTRWGDESPWLAHIASLLAGTKPSVTVLVNGGEIALKDVSESVKIGRPVLVIAGSGRLADTLAASLRGEATDEPIRELVASGLLRTLHSKESFEYLTQMIKEMLSSKP